MFWKPRLTQRQAADLSLDLLDASLTKAEGQPQNYTAAELVRLNVDIIVAAGGGGLTNCTTSQRMPWSSSRNFPNSAILSN